MQSKASANMVRIAPRKARLVVDLIRGKQIGEALSILAYTNKAATPIVEKVLKSAIANAEHNFDMNIPRYMGGDKPHQQTYEPRSHRGI